MYFSTPKNESISLEEEAESERQAYIYAAGIVLCTIVSICFTHPFFIYAWQLGIRLRATCSSVIFRKALRLTKAFSIPGLNGRMINLMSCDTMRFNLAIQFIHLLWKGPLEIIVFSYFLHREIGFYGFIGIGLILCFVPIQSKHSG